MLAQADPELRREVESLLYQDSGAGLLAHPAMEAAVELLEEGTAAEPAPAAQPSYIGQYVGQYRILAKIGEGGMGVVYEAEQLHPRRSVALKMLRGGGLVHDWMLRMFQRETDALARLRHPGIGDVYESGVTETGQHYFTMELVRGVSLNEYWLARRERETTPTAALQLRLAVFDKICSAVSYAHQRGVIHRDLKPSNIFIVSGSEEDVVPETKILDFGLARITEDAGATTLVTGLHGTLAYMSPEQSRGVSEEIDLRTDVYSLGVIFYEMLTGVLPYETAGKELVEAVQAICQDSPRPLKTSWNSWKLEKDLGAVVLKALEKDPARRYQSVSALADDVQRYRSGQPVLAQPPSTLYQARKLVARHKFGFAFAATLVFILAAFAVTMAVQAGRIADERNRANREAEAARQVSGFLVGLFEVSDPGEARGNSITARELLDRGAEKIERELKDQPLSQARMKFTIGKVLLQLGLYQKAAVLLEGAAAIQEARLGAPDSALMESLDRLATAYQELGLYAKAEPLFRRALAISQNVLGPEHRDTASALTNLAGLCVLTAKYAEAESLLKRAIEIQKKYGQDRPDAADTLTNLAVLYETVGRQKEATDHYRQTLALRERILPPDHPDIAQGLNNLGVALWRQKEYAEAVPLLERSLAIFQKVLGPGHSQVGRLMANLATLYTDQGQLDKAEPLYLRSLEIREKALGPAHPDFAHSLNRLAGLRAKQGKYPEAAALYERAIDTYDKALGADSLESAITRNGLANLYRDHRKFGQAEPLYRRALAGMEKAVGPKHPNFARVLDNYAAMLRLAGRPGEAEPLEARAKEIRGPGK